MGRNMPSQNQPALTWLEGHIAQWTASAATIGLTSAQTTDLLAQIVDTRGSFTSVEAVRADSQAITSEFNTKASTMRKAASLMIADIKSYANNQIDPAPIYTAAGITPADPKTPVGAPEQPAGMTTAVNGNGSITLNFVGRGPTGTVWEVTRKLAGETSFTHVGHADVTTKSFTDNTVPSTVSSATYLIRGVRGNDAGLYSAPFGVQFGGADGAAVSQAA